MATATITISDNTDGTEGVNMGLDFGDAIDENSQAHSMIIVLAESVLKNANHYKKIEDTAPAVDIEPSLIITPD